MRYAPVPRVRTLWRVVDADDQPVPGELHEHFGRAMAAAALLDVTTYSGSHSVRPETEQVPTWRAA